MTTPFFSADGGYRKIPKGLFRVTENSKIKEIRFSF